MKIIIALLGAFVFAGQLQQPIRSYCRPASTFSGWGLNGPSFAIWTIEVSA
ncbi:hypothetical protein P2T68_17020 [Pseudomonas sp. G11]|uniref:hypothetical protein n=1 Tax=Pseudomonas sp. G11 TaxID=528343 RepID=UPI0024026E7F|nr:hypothetical protein [Pseudomonas sp. G11]WEX18947.1 hypothetical protein P2T68_17020 [Pseudomonas sp. G11]